MFYQLRGLVPYEFIVHDSNSLRAIFLLRRYSNQDTQTSTEPLHPWRLSVILKKLS